MEDTGRSVGCRQSCSRLDILAGLADDVTMPVHSGKHPQAGSSRGSHALNFPESSHMSPWRPRPVHGMTGHLLPVSDSRWPERARPDFVLTTRLPSRGRHLHISPDPTSGPAQVFKWNASHSSLDVPAQHQERRGGNPRQQLQPASQSRPLTACVCK